MCYLLLLPKILNLVGLGMGFVGVVFISWGFFTKSEKDIEKDAGIKFDGGEGQKKFLKKQITGVQIGLPFIILGFILQFIGALYQ